MSFAKIGLMVMLEGAPVRKQEAGGCELAPKECVCAKSGSNRPNSCGVKSSGKSVT